MSKSDLEELGENTEDLAEGFSKYAKEIKALTGFDIMIDETHFKDLYDIMEGISGVWDKLSDTQQARVAEILGGTRQLQVISSIIGNWKDAAGAYETAINSAGASSKANAIYMESVTAHLDQMKAAFEELSTNVMNSGFTKFIIDTGKTILEILNNITKLTGSLGTILIGGAIYKGVKSIASAYKELDSTKRGIDGLISVFKHSNTVNNFSTAISGVKTAFAEATTNGEKFKAVLSGVKDGISGISTGGKIALLIAAIALLSQLFKKISELLPTIENTANRLDESSAKVKSIKSEIDNLNGELKTSSERLDELLSKDNPSFIEQEEIDKLRSANAELEREIKLKEAALKSQNKENAKNFNENVGAITMKKPTDDIPWWAKHSLGALSGAFFSTWETFSDNASQDFVKKAESYKTYATQITDLKKQISDAIDKGKSDDEIKQLQSRLEMLKNYSESYESDMEAYVTSLREAREKLGDVDYSTLSDDTKQFLDYIQDVENTFLSLGGDNFDDILQNTYNSDRFKDGKEAIEALKESGDLTGATLQNLYESGNEGVIQLVENWKQVGLINDTTATSFEKLANHINGVNKAVEGAPDVTQYASLKELFESTDGGDDSFSARIKTYRENINSLTEALEKYKNGELDEDTYHGLVEKFPQLAGRTKDLDVAITELMDDMDSDMVSDFDDQFGKLETQEDIDALKEYESQVLSTRKTAAQFQSDIENLVSVFGTVKSAVEEYNENGFLTLSSLQSVLSLNDKYISVLTNEQGALDLSTESYKKLVEAELIELKAQTLQNSLDTVRNIDNRSEALAYLNEREHSAAQSSLDLADAQWQEALSAAAVKDIQEGTGDLYQRTVLAAREAYDTRIALIDEYARTAFTIGELSTATDEYSKALDNEKEALENSKKALEDQKSALEDTKQGYEDALSAVKDLVSWVQDYIKQIKNDEIDALQEKKDAIDELIEAQKDLLDAEKDEYEWNKKISEKQNTVAKDALAASVASLDDSSAGRKAQKQANDKLAESRSDMLDTLYDHEIEIRKDALDKLKEEQDEYYDNLIDNIQDYLNNEVQLYKDACAMIDNDSGDLYGKLLWYCQNYTTTTEAEFNHMWNSAQSALQQYNTANLGTFELLNDLQGRIYEVDNAIDTISQSISSYESAIDGVQGKLDNLSQSAQKAISDIQAAANAEDEWTKPKWVYTWQDNDYKSWKVNRDAAISDIIKQIESRYGGVFPASAATIYGTIRKYASGTNSAAGGLSLVGERGAELHVLNQGDGILNHRITQGLAALGANPAQFIADAGKKLLSSLFGNSIKPSFSAIGTGNNQPISIVNHIQGDVNPSTLKALVAAQKKIVQESVKEMQLRSLSLRATNRI